VILSGRVTAINRTSRVETPDGKLRWIDSFVGISWAGTKAARRVMTFRSGTPENWVSGAAQAPRMFAKSSQALRGGEQKC
jgi:hypothetical protein